VRQLCRTPATRTTLDGGLAGEEACKTVYRTVSVGGLLGGAQLRPKEQFPGATDPLHVGLIRRSNTRKRPKAALARTSGPD